MKHFQTSRLMHTEVDGIFKSLPSFLFSFQSLFCIKKFIELFISQMDKGTFASLFIFQRRNPREGLPNKQGVHVVEEIRGIISRI